MIQLVIMAESKSGVKRPFAHPKKTWFASELFFWRAFNSKLFLLYYCQVIEKGPHELENENDGHCQQIDNAKNKNPLWQILCSLVSTSSTLVLCWIILAQKLGRHDYVWAGRMRMAPTDYSSAFRKEAIPDLFADFQWRMLARRRWVHGTVKGGFVDRSWK